MVMTMYSIEFSVHICYIQVKYVQSRGGQTNINKEYSICQYNITMCSIERKTIPSDRAMALMLSVYIM